MAQQKEKIDKIVTPVNDVKHKKISDAFISPNTGSIKEHIVFNVLIPTIKNTASTIIKNTTDMIFGTTSNTINSNNLFNVPRVNYNTMSTQNNILNSQMSNVAVAPYDNIKVATRADADLLLTTLNDIITRCGVVSVANLYDLVGIKNTFIDHRIGWTNLTMAQAVQVNDGFIMQFPRPTAF